MDTTAERIKIALEIRNMKQADLIAKTGINKGALSCYISGKYNPKQTNTYLLAKALNVSEEWLMGKDVPMERTESTPDDQLNPIVIEHIKNYSQLPPEWKSLIDELILTAQAEPRESDKVLELTQRVMEYLRS